jgi:transcription-repair coupling factor (superfamily II helicase)
MAERELEHVMRDFYQQRVNLLLCSTIIETGIDVPTANTIIIDRAIGSGWRQLHQLRGPRRPLPSSGVRLSTDAARRRAVGAGEERLEAIQMMEDLGSGFYLAMHDLEIRGAGEVLGESQSGEMQQVGFQLYNDMLRASVSALKSGREPDLGEPLGVTTEINLHVPALLPTRYCDDVHERLVLYKRLARRGDRGRIGRDPGRARGSLRTHARPGARAARLPSPALAGETASGCPRSIPAWSGRPSSS